MHPRLMYALSDVCVCGHAFGRHRGVPEGEPAPCKADDDTCPCGAFALAPPTDVSELAPEDRITENPPPPTLEEQLSTLVIALAESNALSIQAREASERVAALCASLLDRLADGDKLFRQHDARLRRLESHLGLPPL